MFLKDFIPSLKALWVSIYKALPLEKRNGLSDDIKSISALELRAAVVWSVRSYKNWSSAFPAPYRIERINRSDKRWNDVHSALLFDGTYLLECGQYHNDIPRVIIIGYALKEKRDPLVFERTPEAMRPHLRQVLLFSHQQINSTTVRVAYCASFGLTAWVLITALVFYHLTIISHSTIEVVELDLTKDKASLLFSDTSFEPIVHHLDFRGRYLVACTDRSLLVMDVENHYRAELELAENVRHSILDLIQ